VYRPAKTLLDGTKSTVGLKSTNDDVDAGVAAAIVICVGGVADRKVSAAFWGEASTARREIFNEMVDESAET
jgi:hypothetical protein